MELTAHHRRSIGDEPVLETVPGTFLNQLMGSGQYDDTVTSQSLYDKAREMYNVFHIHVRSTGSGSRQSVMDGWQQMLHDNLLIAAQPTDIGGLISKTVTDMEVKNGGSQITDTEDVGVTEAEEVGVSETKVEEPSIDDTPGWKEETVL